MSQNAKGFADKWSAQLAADVRDSFRFELEQIQQMAYAEGLASQKKMESPDADEEDLTKEALYYHQNMEARCPPRE